jgi:hypothetical protein
MTGIRKTASTLALALALGLGAAAAGAQLRTVPAEAKRGYMMHVQESAVRINGKLMLLAPGAQIRDAGNMIVVPAAVPAGSLVRYTIDANGNVGRVWILSAQEAARSDPRR